MNHEDDPAGASDDDPQESHTLNGLPLGKKATQFIDIICIATFALLLGIAVFVLMNVALDTRTPYEGVFGGIVNPGREGIPAPIAMLICPVAVLLCWLTGRMSDLQETPERFTTRRFLQISTMLVIIFFGVLIGQMVLNEAGYFSGR